MMIVGQEKPSLEDLAHYGTKGMKWGVRKKHYSGKEIRAARSRQAQKMREAERANDAAATATSKSARSAALKRRNALAKDILTNEDRVTAARLTTGEKFAVHLLGTPAAGLAAQGANALTVRSIAKSVDRARALADKG